MDVESAEEDVSSNTDGYYEEKEDSKGNGESPESLSSEEVPGRSPGLTTQTRKPAVISDPPLMRIPANQGAISGESMDSEDCGDERDTSIHAPDRGATMLVKSRIKDITESDGEDLLEVWDPEGGDDDEDAYLLHPSLGNEESLFSTHVGPQSRPPMGDCNEHMPSFVDSGGGCHQDDRIEPAEGITATQSTTELSDCDAREVYHLARTFERELARDLEMGQKIQSPILARAGDMAWRDMPESEKSRMVRREERQEARALGAQTREEELLRLFWNILYGLCLFVTLGAVILSVANKGVK
mmetsp:Transcript_2073/g.4181  ORF Transcript_2073/g.4181 Transcript_2073/m.4181 type:complete len:299 (+) Transcript_2073:83-979(+)